MKNLILIGFMVVAVCITGSVIAKEYDFGDMTSQTLTTNAWQALEVKDYDAVMAYTNKGIELYKGKALVMNTSLNDFPKQGQEFDYWALNDVATCYHIKGMALKEQGKLAEAKDAFNTIIKDYKYAQAWDPKGWFWSVANAAKDQLKVMELEEKTGKVYDFGDYSSMTLAVNSWGALEQQDWIGLELYTKKCIDMYSDQAKQQQAELNDYLSKDKAFNAWALNDVGTCYFILGKGLMQQERYKEAKEAFQKLIDDFSFAQCWDPRGWFWKPAVGARKELNKIIAQTSA